MSGHASGARPYHPGWRGWFTWGGYRGRLSYLGATVLAGLAAVAAVTALAAVAGIGAGNAWTVLAIAGIAGIALVVLAGIVAWICILAQRMRDIGMPVVPSLIGYGLASAVASAGVAVSASQASGSNPARSVNRQCSSRVVGSGSAR